MILSGDIGGTNTRLALFELAGGYEKKGEARFLSREHSGLCQMIDKYLGQDKPKLACACFAVAGPVRDGHCKLTNLSWEVDRKELENYLKVPVFLLNDLEANGWGLEVLTPEDFIFLQKGNLKQSGNAVLVSAGTGLGEAGLFWDGKMHHPLASEGGHTDFAARNPFEFEIFLFFQKLYGEHVSYERIVSGPGLHALYQFLIEKGHEKESKAVRQEMEKGNPSAVIVERAAGKDPACEKALELFLSFYGAEAGNAALKFLALGGVFLGGGIAPQVVKHLQKGGFIKSFLNKGRFKALLESIPVRIILNDETALLGTAVYAHRTQKQR